MSQLDKLIALRFPHDGNGLDEAMWRALLAAGAGWNFGPGEDGALDIVGPTTVNNKTLSLTTLIVELAQTLTLPGGAIIYANDHISILGTLSARGANGATPTAPPSAGGAGGATGAIHGGAGGNGGVSSGAGDQPTAGATAVDTGLDSSTFLRGSVAPAAAVVGAQAGGAGGQGSGAHPGAAGGTDDAVITKYASPFMGPAWLLDLVETFSPAEGGCGGGGGGGDGAANAGGGGGGGGAGSPLVILAAPKVTISGTWDARGGNGGDGHAGSAANTGGGGGGSGGQGGPGIIIAEELDTTGATIEHAGGAGGNGGASGGGTGAAGVAGAAGLPGFLAWFNPSSGLWTFL